MALLDLPDNHDLGHLRAALKLFDGRNVAIDGGAHRGIWSRELTKHFSKVIAFEPVGELVDRIDCEVAIVHAALGDCHGEVMMKPGTENNGQSHVAEIGERARMVPLDFYTQGLTVDFIKLDVEGYELMALKGAQETILRCRPAIMVEQNGLSARYGYTDSDLAEWLGDHGYQLAENWNKDFLYLA